MEQPTTSKKWKLVDFGSGLASDPRALITETAGGVERLQTA
jgi:hypothetical protein